ncbi:MAG: RNA polymerase sigma factor [Desulfobacterota bacterium]|nr:RNA polymerase sigma factor [Thermodesulfobacteriota bacterium]
MVHDPDVQLMLRFQRGDEAAFRQLYEKYKIPLLNFIFRYCQDRRIAEELSQDVFLRVYTKAGSYRPDAMFSTWLYRIAINICLNELRSGKYRFEYELKTVDADHGDKFIEAPDHTRSINAEDKLDEEERGKRVRHALAALPPKHRVALICSVYEQLPYKEIGRRIGCSEAAVKSIIHRSKLALRDLLRKRKLYE